MLPRPPASVRGPRLPFSNFSRLRGEFGKLCHVLIETVKRRSLNSELLRPPRLPAPRPPRSSPAGPQAALSGPDPAPGGRPRGALQARARQFCSSPARVSGGQGVLLAPQPSAALGPREAAERSALGSQPCLPASPRPASAPHLSHSRLLSQAARRTQPASLSAFTTGSSCGGREGRQRRSGPPPGARAPPPLSLPPPLLPVLYN